MTTWRCSSAVVVRLRSLVLPGLLLMLLVPAAVLTVVRVWQPQVGWAIRTVAFTPLALPLYAVAVVLLLAAGLRSVRRRGWLLAILALTVPMVLHGWWLAPQYAGRVPSPAAGAQPVRILTANLWHGQVGGLKVVAAAKQAHADVLVLEEVRPKQLQVMDNGGLAELWPYRAGTTGVEVSGTMVFSRFALTDIERLPTRLGCWEVTVAAPDGPWRLVAVHTTSPVQPDEWTSDLDAVLAAAADADLVVGDLNATPDHRPFRRLEAVGLRSAAELTNAGWQPTWPAPGAYSLAGLLPGWPLVQIDHVLVGPRVTAMETSTVSLEGTDHLALLADVAAR